MNWIHHLDLIRALGLYLTATFLLGTAMRVRQYQAVGRLVRCFPDRWPRLLKLAGAYHAIFLTWSNLWPMLLALCLCITQFIAARLIWPHAELTLKALAALWPVIPILALIGLAMLIVDVYATFTVGKVDQFQLEKHFDQAEYWLKTWVAPVVRFFTLGYINPRAQVKEEVRKALIQVSQLLNWAMKWVIVQNGLRLAFGLTLWLTWAFS